MPYINIECSMRKGANLFFRIGTKWKKVWKKPITDYQLIPVIINNFNRFEYLSLLITWLEKAGYKNIYIIDNNSTYPPLLDYYSKLPYTIFKLDKNKGHFALWETIIFSRFSGDYYVYTDPDILPINKCPDEVLLHFKELLDKYPAYKKAGFGLIIDDLPNHYSLKYDVINWEQKFWIKEIEKDVFDSLIDTTFALYRPGAKGGGDSPAIRTGGNFIARHLPWYENLSILSEETKYYLNSINSSSSWYSTAKNGKTYGE